MNKISEFQTPEFEKPGFSKRSNRIVIIAWFLFFCVALYLYIHWNAPVRRSLLNLLPLPIALFFLLSSTGYGSIFQRWVPSTRGFAIPFLTLAGIGIGCTGLFIFLLGLLGLLKGIVMLVWTLLGFLLFVRSFLRLKFSAAEKIEWNIWNLTGALIIAVFLAQSLPFVVSPELTTDALEYHLLIPKIYIGLGKIEYIPLLVESNYPSLAEYNFLPMMKLSTEITCKAFHFWMGILVLLLLTQIVSIVSEARSKLLAPAFFLSMPVTATILGWAWNELLFTFLVLLCLFYLVQYELRKEQPDRNLNLLLAGVMAGLASWTKYTFVMFFGAIFVFYLIGIWRWKWEWKKFGLILIPVVLISSLWIVKNWIFTGNPVYPFLNHVFQSPYWTSTADRYFRGALTRYEIPNWDWKTYFLFPFLMTLKPRVIDVHTGILPLLFLPFLFFKSSSRGLSMLKMYVLSYILVWLFIQTYVRSLLSALAVLFCIGAVAIPQFTSGFPRLKVACTALIVASVGAAFFITIVSTNYLFQPIPYFIGIETKGQYLSKYAASQRSYDFLNKAPDVQRALLVGLHNPFYLNRPYFFSSCCDPPVAEVLSSDTNTAAEFTFKLKKLGVTHIVWNQEEYERENNMGLYSWDSTKRKMFETFLAQDCRPVAHFGTDQVLEMNQ